MVNVVEYLNEALNQLVLTDKPMTGLDSVYFLLTFFLVFSITFTATAFIPMFKDKKEYNNIRMLIAFSMAFLTSVSFYSVIIQQIQFFGLIMAIALGIAITLLVIIPKDKRKDWASKVTIIAILAALIIFFTIIQGVDLITPVIEWLETNWSFMLDTGLIIWLPLIIIAIFIIIGVVKSKG